MTRSDAGRIGGLQTFFRYGSEGMRERGLLGGRPRLPALTDLRQHSAREAPLAERKKLPNGLRDLKALYKLHENNGGSDPSSPQKGEEQ